MCIQLRRRRRRRVEERLGKAERTKVDWRVDGEKRIAAKRVKMLGGERRN